MKLKRPASSNSMEVILRLAAKEAGLSRYFTGKPCGNGHISERSASTGVCLVCKRAASKRERAADPDFWNRWRLKNQDIYRAYRREFYLKNRKNHLAIVARTRDPLKHRLRQHKRRAIKLASSGQHSIEDAMNLLRVQGFRCACGCGAKIGKKGRGGHIDHIQPLSKGGTNDKYNIQWLADKCNLSKHARDPIEWRQSLGQLL